MQETLEKMPVKKKKKKENKTKQNFFSQNIL